MCSLSFISINSENTKILPPLPPPPTIVQTNSNGDVVPIVGINKNTTKSKSNSKNERGKAFRQVVAAFVANLGTINTGLIFGFSAVVIPQLRAKDSIISIDENQASWIGKCFN